MFNVEIPTVKEMNFALRFTTNIGSVTLRHKSSMMKAIQKCSAWTEKIDNFEVAHASVSWQQSSLPHEPRAMSVNRAADGMTSSPTYRRPSSAAVKTRGFILKFVFPPKRAAMQIRELWMPTTFRDSRHPKKHAKGARAHTAFPRCPLLGSRAEIDNPLPAAVLQFDHA
jgi:hypothetical protein